MKKIAFALLAGSTLLLAACDTPSKGNGPSTPANSSQDDSGGLGFTYRGKMGLDLGNGLVLPFDGSGLSFGYGIG